MKKRSSKTHPETQIVTTRKTHNCEKCKEDISQGENAYLVYFVRKEESGLKRGRYYCHLQCAPELKIKAKSEVPEAEEQAERLEELGEHLAAAIIWEMLYKKTKLEKYLTRSVTDRTIARRTHGRQ